jgi:circadian clock protein KaiC
MRRGAVAAGAPSSGNAVEPRRTLTDRPAPEARVASGVPGLDDLIGGGFPRLRTVLLCGDIGTGKTTFGVQFLMAGVSRGEAGVFVSVDEKPQHVIADARRFGWDVAGAVSRGLLTVLDASPFFMALRGRDALDARHVASDLAQQVRQTAASRLVIDGVTSLAPSGPTGDGAEDFMRSLILSLEDNLGCTTLMTTRTDAGTHPTASGSPAERLTSGVIELKHGPLAYQTERQRSLLVRKMRGGPTPTDQRPFDIVDGCGLVLREPLPSFTP